MIDFKLIIAGTRTFSDYSIMQQALDMYFQKYNLLDAHITVICGEAQGADKMGKQFAEVNQWDVISMPAAWDKHGKSAGYKRNVEMAQIADGCIVFWDGQSKGSSHMIDIAVQHELKAEVVRYEPD